LEKVIKKIGAVILIPAFINCLSFIIPTEYYGGGPDKEASVNGTYYLSSHGKLTEVDHSTYKFMQFHEASFAAGALLAMIGGVLWKYDKF
jgi:hypothetical protein